MCKSKALLLALLKNFEAVTSNNRSSMSPALPKELSRMLQASCSRRMRQEELGTAAAFVREAIKSPFPPPSSPHLRFYLQRCEQVKV